MPAETAEESACASDVLTAAKVLLQLLSKVDSANKSVVLAATMLEFKLLTNEEVRGKRGNGCIVEGGKGWVDEGSLAFRAALKATVLAVLKLAVVNNS